MRRSENEDKDDKQMIKVIIPLRRWRQGRNENEDQKGVEGNNENENMTFLDRKMIEMKNVKMPREKDKIKLKGWKMDDQKFQK